MKPIQMNVGSTIFLWKKKGQPKKNPNPIKLILAIVLTALNFNAI